MPRDANRSQSADDPSRASITRRRFSTALAAGAAYAALNPETIAGQSSVPPAQSELCEMTAVELASRLARKQVSAREVMTAHLAQIERLNPKVNAIVTLVAEQAMAGAARADEAITRRNPIGVLHGLPVAHKDLLDTAGIRTTRGSPFYRDHVPTRDALIVTRMRAAGAITVGKTNTPEFGAGSQTFKQRLRSDPESLRRHEDLRRQQRRGGNRRGRPYAADRRRQRHRRLSP